MHRNLFRLLARLLGQLREKYFDYFVFNIVDFFRLKFDGFRSAFIRVDYVCVDYIRVDSVAFWSALTAACHTRGLAVAHSAPLGGLTSPGLCVKAHAQDLRF
jgi:hypothetical protein